MPGAGLRAWPGGVKGPGRTAPSKPRLQHRQIKIQAGAHGPRGECTRRFCAVIGAGAGEQGRCRGGPGSQPPECLQDPRGGGVTSAAAAFVHAFYFYFFSPFRVHLGVLRASPACTSVVDRGSLGPPSPSQNIPEGPALQAVPPEGSQLSPWHAVAACSAGQGLPSTPLCRPSPSMGCGARTSVHQMLSGIPGPILFP